MAQSNPVQPMQPSADFKQRATELQATLIERIGPDRAAIPLANMASLVTALEAQRDRAGRDLVNMNENFLLRSEQSRHSMVDALATKTALLAAFARENADDPALANAFTADGSTDLNVVEHVVSALTHQHGPRQHLEIS